MNPQTEFPRAQCLSVMDALSRFSISKMFSQPVDPVRDNVPNYFAIVKRPMDLSTVRRKLEENRYASVAEWKADVDTIWANSLLVNEPGSVLGCITLEMQAQWQRLSAGISGDAESDWLARLLVLRDALANFPKRKNRQSLFAGSAPKAKAKSKAPKASKQQPQQQPKPSPKRNFTRAEICRLSSDINAHVTDPVQVQSIFDILCRNEKNLSFKDEFLELDLCTVQKATLALLRERVDEIMRRETK